MITKKKRKQHKEDYEWIVNELQKEITPQKSYLIFLERLYSPEREVTDAALSEIEGRANEFPQELISCYKILSNQMRERMMKGNDSGSWYYRAIADGVASLSGQYYNEKVSLLWEDLKHPMPWVRDVVIGELSIISNTNKELKKRLWTARSYQFNSDEETERFGNSIAKALNFGDANSKNRK